MNADPARRLGLCGRGPRAVAVVVAVVLLLGTMGLQLIGVGAVSADANAPNRVLPIPGEVVRGFQVGEQNWEPGHRGIDLAGFVHQSVVAASSGVVSWSGTIAGVPMVTVQHPDGLRTTYQPVVAGVETGSQVAVGQQIGTLQAGHCPGRACLHWGVRDGDAYLDPLAWLGGWQDAEVRLLPGSAVPRQLPPPGIVEGVDAQAAPGGLPVAGPITSGFGSRVNPISGIAEFHDGVDIGAPCGAPISVSGSGTVTFAGVAGGYGLRVEVDHGGTGTSYSHLSAISVAVGDQVGTGTVIGLVGSTGFSTGCHLHYSMTVGGLPVDPLGQ